MGFNFTQRLFMINIPKLNSKIFVPRFGNFHF